MQKVVGKGGHLQWSSSHVHSSVTCKSIWMFQSIFNLPGMGSSCKWQGHQPHAASDPYLPSLACWGSCSHSWSQRSCLHLLCVVTELGKTLSDGQSMQKYELKTEGMEGFGERVTIKQNLCDQSSQVKSQVRQQLSSSFQFPTVTSLSLLASVSWSRSSLLAWPVCCPCHPPTVTGKARWHKWRGAEKFLKYLEKPGWPTHRACRAEDTHNSSASQTPPPPAWFYFRTQV